MSDNQMPEPWPYYYKLNSARCKLCGDTLISTDDDASKLHECSCGNLVITGGCSTSHSLIRYVGQVDFYKDHYEELSQYDTGHPISTDHAIIKPRTALESFRPGKCFIQHHIHSPERGWHMVDEYGQSLQAVEIIVGRDRLPWTVARFRFRPVSGLNLYINGALSRKGLDFLRYIQDIIIPKFMERGQTKNALIEILLEEGFQDRTGMDRNGQEMDNGRWQL